ncbi:MAG: hypothetical protein V3U43_01640 [Pseudomonadales bacterium]
MSDSKQDTVELLEVFYARSIKKNISHGLERLRDDCNFLPDFDAQRRLEIMAYYERMLLTCTHLLQQLGDVAYLDEGTSDLNPGV